MRLIVWTLAIVVTGTTVASTAPSAARRMAADSTSEARNRMAKIMLDSLGDRATLPAESIWANLKTGLAKVPARNLIAIMNMGFGKSLGVTCEFCHVAGHFDKEDSTQKQIAREMFKMVPRINQELLAAIPGIQNKNPIVNCTTCHRGRVKPALSLDDPGSN
jgi:hypothetical protein